MGVSQNAVEDALRNVQLAGSEGNLVDEGLVRLVEVHGGRVKIGLVVPAARAAEVSTIRDQAHAAASSVDGVDDVDVDLTVMPPPQGVGPTSSQKADDTWADRIAGVRHVVAVASGKGGVGKSTVAANLAVALAAQGRRVGLLDADIYGPSQQLMMPSGERPKADDNDRLIPLEGPGGVGVISIGFLMDADQPVIWRGPLLMKAMEQLISDVAWGELDELIVDLPPGTGDVAITLGQKIPLSGVVIVTTPQDVALIDARKGLVMFNKLGAPVIGIVENMSSFICPECGHSEPVFGSGGGERTAAELGVPLIATVPIDSRIVTGGDGGRPILIDQPDAPASEAFLTMARAVVSKIEADS